MSTTTSDPKDRPLPTVLDSAIQVARSRVGAQITFVVVALLGWQFVVPLLPTELFPYPSEVFSFMWDELRGDTLAPDNVYAAFWLTLQRLLTGFVLAIAIGIPVGIVMGMWKGAEAFFRDFVIALLTMPDLVWALVFAMWLGFGNTAPVLTVTLAALPFVILNVWEGVRAVPRDLLDMGGAYGLSRWTLIRHVVVPSQMPFMFSAFRYGFANGWKGAVVAEVFAAGDGAGWTIRYWYDAHRAYGVIGYALFFIIFALILERVIFRTLHKRVFRWRPSVAEASRNV